MNVFKRVQNIVLANVNELLEKLENPVSMVKYYITELESEITEAETTLTEQLILKKSLQVSIGETEEVIAKRERQAKLAVETGEENIAKLALQDKLIQQNKLEVQQKQLETLENQITVLVDRLKELKEKYGELKNKQTILIARAKAAQSIQKLNTSIASTDSARVLKEFARMEERVAFMEIEANAVRNSHEIGRTVESHFAEQQLKEQVEKELEKLKVTQSVSD